MRARELLAKNVLALRLDLKLSVRGLAEAAGLSRDGVRKIEASEGDAKLDTLDALAAALGVPAARLIEEIPAGTVMPPPLKRGRKKKDA